MLDGFRDLIVHLAGVAELDENDSLPLRLQRFIGDLQRLLAVEDRAAGIAVEAMLELKGIGGEVGVTEVTPPHDDARQFLYLGTGRLNGDENVRFVDDDQLAQLLVRIEAQSLIEERQRLIQLAVPHPGQRLLAKRFDPLDDLAHSSPPRSPLLSSHSTSLSCWRLNSMKLSISS